MQCSSRSAHKKGGLRGLELVHTGSILASDESRGDLMTPMGMYPERYRVEGFPTSDQLAAMGNQLEGS